MSYEINWSNWIASLGSCISALAAWQMWKVSQRTLNLQQMLEAQKIPLVHVWYNGTQLSTPNEMGGITLINIGREPLPVRKLRILGNNRQAVSFKLLNPTQIKVKMYASDQPELLPKLFTESKDFILMPNEIFEAEIKIDTNQLVLEFMYFDNSFEFLEINTSVLGGKYILTGKGGK